MEEEIDIQAISLKKPESHSLSIHAVHELLGKHIERSSQKKGRDSTSNYQKFYSYCEKMLDKRKNVKYDDQTQKLKTQQLLELFDSGSLSYKQKVKIAQNINYLQNKIWDLDIVEPQSIKSLIPVYNELFDKLKNLPNAMDKQNRFENLIQEVANDLFQSSR